MQENKTGPVWAAMELESSLPLSTVSILSSSLPSNLSLQHLGSVIRNYLKIWLQFRKHFHFNQPITLLPLVRNHLFPPSQADTAFEMWHRNGLVFFRDLFADGTFASFDLLQKDSNIPKNNFFRYLQVRSFAKKPFLFPQLPPKDVLSTILELDPSRRRRVAKIYQMLQDIDPPSRENTRLEWEKDLDILLPEEIWQKSLKRIHTTSLCIRHGLIQFKAVHRLHYSCEKMAKLCPNINPECPRCSNNPATVGHMFWSMQVSEPLLDKGFRSCVLHTWCYCRP